MGFVSYVATKTPLTGDKLKMRKDAKEGRVFWLAIKRSRKDKTFLITWSHGIMMLQKRLKFAASWFIFSSLDVDLDATF